MPVADAMRAPGEAVGMLALERRWTSWPRSSISTRSNCACATSRPKIPRRHEPFSTRQLVECLREGAGGSAGNAAARARRTCRDGQWLIGLGMAAAIRGNFLLPAKAKVRLDGSGRSRSRWP